MPSPKIIIDTCNGNSKAEAEDDKLKVEINPMLQYINTAVEIPATGQVNEQFFAQFEESEQSSEGEEIDVNGTPAIPSSDYLQIGSYQCDCDQCDYDQAEYYSQFDDYDYDDGYDSWS
jgi:hypothetical protein